MRADVSIVSGMCRVTTSELASRSSRPEGSAPTARQSSATSRRSVARIRHPNPRNRLARSRPTLPHPMIPTVRPDSCRPMVWFHSPARTPRLRAGRSRSRAMIVATTNSATARLFTPPDQPRRTPRRLISERSSMSVPTPYLLTTSRSGNRSSRSPSIRSRPMIALCRPARNSTRISLSSFRPSSLNATSS